MRSSRNILQKIRAFHLLQLIDDLANPLAVSPLAHEHGGPLDDDDDSVDAHGRRHSPGVEEQIVSGIDELQPTGADERGRWRVSSGSSYEPLIKFSRAVRVGDTVRVFVDLVLKQPADSTPQRDE